MCLLQEARAGDGQVPKGWGDRSGGTVSLGWGGTIACSMAKPISAKEGEIPEVMSIKEDKCRSHRSRIGRSITACIA